MSLARIPRSLRHGPRRPPLLASVVGLVLVVQLGGVGKNLVWAQDDRAAAPQYERLTLDRLYSLPSLIGTAPSGFAWSTTGRSLAFLWNDKGRPFRDVWVLDLDDSEAMPRRMTEMAAFEPEEAAEDLGVKRGTDGESKPLAAARAQERIERDTGVTSVLWHPDGHHLVVGFRGDLWLVAPDAPPRRWATGTQPAFAPHGGHVAFLRDGDVWTLPASTRVTPGAATAAVVPKRATSVAIEVDGRRDVVVTRFAWSATGDALAVLEEDRRGVTVRGIPDYLGDETTMTMIRRAYPGEPAVAQRLGVINMRRPGSEVAWLSLGAPRPDMVLDFAWSPKGRRLAVDTSDLYAKDRRVFVVDVGTEAGLLMAGPARVVARDRDDDNETFYFWRIAWAVDATRLYFLSDRAEDYHVWAVAPDGDAPPTRLTQGPWAVADLHPVAGGLVVVGNRGRAEERHLFRVSDSGGEPVRLSERPGTHAATVAPDGRYAAVTHSSDATPPDLFVIALGPRRDERRVTHSPLPAFDDFRWVTPRYVSFPSHVDGTTLHGRLTLPPDFDPSRTYPAILGSVYTDSVRNQWGGRTAHPTWGLDQYLAQEGYVLLNVDMRGSWGRGRDHRRGIRLDYGGMDIEDLASGVHFLRAEGYVDPERIGLWGSSYGGLMTAMSLFRKPDLYAAGVAGAPATNVWHALTGQMAVMMRPQDQPEEYADSSPFKHAHGLQDPLMIIHGMRDWVVLYKDSVALVQRLIQLDKDVELVTLPNAGHGWDNEGLAQTRYAFRRLVDHFNRHLRLEEGPR